MEQITPELDPLRQFIRDVQGSFALMAEPSPDLFSLPPPRRPYLIFELLDRTANDPAVRDAWLVPPHYHPYVFHQDWEKELEELRKRDCLSPISAILGKTEDPNPSDLRSCIEHVYEKWEIPLDLLASGVIWDAWRRGIFLDSNVDLASRGLFLKCHPSKENIVSTLKDKLLGPDATGRKEEPNKYDYGREVTIELCLVHQIPRPESESTPLLLVHYPLILNGFWFVGFAYFLVRDDGSYSSPLTRKREYRRCLRELTKQHPSIKQFLKMRALRVPSDSMWEEHSIESIYRNVVGNFFSCFDVSGNGGGPKLAEYEGTAVHVPLEWDVPEVRLKEWSRFVEPSLAELWSAVKDKKHRREERAKLIRAEQNEATSRRILHEVAHGIETDIAYSLGYLGMAGTCLKRSETAIATRPSLAYIRDAKGHISRIGDHTRTLLQLEKYERGKKVPPITKHRFPFDIAEDLRIYCETRSLLRLTGSKERTQQINRFLREEAANTARWITCVPGPFQILQYDILRLGLREILRNALREIRDDRDDAPIRIIIKKTGSGVSIEVANNQAANPSFIEYFNSENVEPRPGQFGISLLKRVFQVCGGRPPRAVSTGGWTTVSVNVSEVGHESATQVVPGR